MNPSSSTESSRRQFIVAGAAVAGAMLSSQSTVAQEAAAAPKKRPWKKAVMDNMPPAQWSVMDKFKLLKDTGFQGIEMHAPGRYKLEEVKEAQDATGIECAGVVDFTHWRVPLSSPTEGEREIAVRDLIAALRACKDYGGTSVLLVPGVVNDKVSNKECWERSIEGIRKALPVCEQTGIKIAVENVGNSFIYTPTEAKAYLDAINSPHVGWHFDIGNHMRHGWPEHWPQVLGSRILKIHVKETPRSGGPKELTEGDTNWPAVMKSLDDNGYAGGWATLEVGGGDLERFKFLSARLDKILAS